MMTEELQATPAPAAQDQGSPAWPSPARYIGLVVLLLGAVLVPLLLRPISAQIFLGFLIGFLMYQYLAALMRYTGVRYGLAVLVTYVVIALICVVLLINIVPVFVQGLGSLSTAIEAAEAEVRAELAAQAEPVSPELTLQALSEQLSTGLSQLSADGGAWASRLAQGLVSVLGNLISLGSVVVSALLFSFFLMLDLARGQGALKGWVPPRYHREAGLLLLSLDRIWGGYLTAQIIYALVLTAGSWLQYTLMGVPFPVVLAVVNGTLSLIPTIGGLIGSLVVAVPCALLGSTVWPDMNPLVFALLVMLVNVLVTQISYNFIAVPVIGKAVRLPMSVVFAGVLLGFAAGSLVLAFLMVPILSTLRALGGYVLAKAARRDPFPGQELPDIIPPGFFGQFYLEQHRRMVPKAGQEQPVEKAAG